MPIRNLHRPPDRLFGGLFRPPVLFMAMIMALWHPVSAHTAGPAAAGEVILELHAADGQFTGFSLDDLRALRLTAFDTSTVWTEDVDRYTGVLLSDLLHHAGVTREAGSGAVSVHAIDGYSAVIDFDLVTERAPLLAFLRNGNPMPVRNQGPIWLIFPYDHDPMFRTETIYALSVWQVRLLRIEQ